VDEKTLLKKKGQPKVLKTINFDARNMTDHKEFQTGDRKENFFRFVKSYVEYFLKQFNIKDRGLEHLAPILEN
jgi:hypothetical protein